MSYRDLYQGRRSPATTPAPAPQPVNESMVDFYARTQRLPVDARAGDGFTEAERRQAREIRFAMDNGQWGLGSIVPHRLAPLVWDGAIPEGMQGMRLSGNISASYDPAGAGDVQSRLARKIDADLHASHPRRNLATDGPQHRPTMSYRLSQVMGDYILLDESSFDDSMKAWGVTEPRDRIALKGEALALGILRARGTPLPQTPRRFLPARHVNDPKEQHFISKDSPAAINDTGGRPDTPGKKHVPGKVTTIQACTAEGYCAYDGTGIDLL